MQVEWPLKLSFAHGIVCGMNYLHSLQPPVIHSALKSRNILISDKFVAKVSTASVASCSAFYRAAAMLPRSSYEQSMFLSVRLSVKRVICNHRRSQDFVCGGALFYHPAKTPKN